MITQSVLGNLGVNLIHLPKLCRPSSHTCFRGSHWSERTRFARAVHARICFLRGAKKGAPPDRVMDPSTPRVVWHSVPQCKHAIYRMPIRGGLKGGNLRGYPSTDAARQHVPSVHPASLFFRIDPRFVAKRTTELRKEALWA